MIGGEVPKLMGKACELFIQELTYRALMQDDDTNKHIVKPSDVAKAILQTDLFDFLTDVLVDYCVSGDKVRRVLFFFFHLLSFIATQLYFFLSISYSIIYAFHDLIYHVRYMQGPTFRVLWIKKRGWEVDPIKGG